jgi:hypothetical protein
LHNALANVINFGLPKSVGSVPDENIGKNSEELSIRLGNLQFANFHNGGANLKKIGYPNLVVGATSNSGILKITLRNTNDRS